MPKVRLGQWAEKDVQFARDLKAGLTKRGKDYKNLARRTGRAQSTVFKRYDKPDTITVNELRGYIQEAQLSKEEIIAFLFME